MQDTSRVHGVITATLYDKDGRVVHTETVPNLITDAGDLYYAKRGAGESTTAANGMRLGTGTTAAAKNGAGAAIVTYPTGVTANRTLDATFPKSNNLGAGAGVEVQYQATWSTSQGNITNIAEVAIVNDAATDANSTAANTYSRALFTSAFTKASGDTLVVSWKHKFLG